MRIGTIQALRAAAALSVVILHVLNEAMPFDPTGTVAAWHDAMPLEAGVDLFFVISGFIMVHSARHLFGIPGAQRAFLRHRLARVVPLYWLFTGLFVLSAAVVGSVRGGVPATAFLVASLVFIPVPGPDGVVQPVLSLGWTLNYEMLFYAIFALFIRLKRPWALAGIVATLCLMASLHPMAAGVQAGFWTDPVILEFPLGMACAVAWPRWRHRLATLARGALAAAALGGVIYLAAAHPELPRWLRAGLPMAMLLAAASTAVDPASSRAWRWLVALGDASYALYLVHPFAMRAVSLAARGVHASGPAAAFLIAGVSLLLAVAAAMAIHRWIERPVSSWGRRRGNTTAQLPPASPPVTRVVAHSTDP